MLELILIDFVFFNAPVIKGIVLIATECDSCLGESSCYSLLNPSNFRTFFLGPKLKYNR